MVRFGKKLDVVIYGLFLRLLVVLMMLCSMGLIRVA